MTKSSIGSRSAKKDKGVRFSFEGRNIDTEQMVRGEVVAKNEEEARKKLQRRGIKPLRVSKVKAVRKKRITQEDITVFTRQLATMMKAGLPLMQAFEIVARGHSNPSMTQMLMQVRADVEQGSALGKAFSKHPKYFDRFYCNLIAAGEAGGVLESLLDKLAVYKEKTQAIKKKVKSALTYPIAIVVVAVVLVFIMMVFVLPEFGKVYSSMGAELPGLTQIVMNISNLMVKYAWVIVVGAIVAGFGLYQWYKRSPMLQKRVDAALLRLPIFGDIVRKATIARWARTTATLFTAGVPLVEVLDSVSGAAGNILYEEATQDIRAKVTQGLSLTSSMQGTDMFPNMVLQMAAIGEESGSLDDMLNKAAEFYEDEVDNAVAQLSSLMEPVIMVVLGSIIGVILVAMYLPLFNLGNVVG
ncbi:MULTISPECIES: type II secretion system F family protein [Neisseria]|uniref:Type II secretion system (T2SS) F family protein n=1 Tax=Neisseria musculi TaxID=1815583 RepID=A0A7H1MDL7_9NEIS|nr:MULTISPECIES: type II secretion system F family protein [Neisseria]MBF0803561.1 type II secretion system F family protein [Neisseria sp. 19428wB4_WF04]QNT59732.1 type II secretion system (T2SS), F family protein [Neisseria musculi]TFU43740.1 type II secretion system F family protein [Neisseria sp. WF04]